MADDTPRPYNSVEIQSAIAAARDKAACVPLDNYDAVTVTDENRLLCLSPNDHDSAVDISPFRRSSVIEASSRQDSALADTTNKDPVKRDIVIPFFEFSDFKADLSLSPTSSATASLSSDPPRPDSPSSTSSAVPSTSASAASPERTSKELPSPRLTPVRSASLMRGSWPLIKYVGRGTPVDPTRRNQWAGSLSLDGVGEDGMMYSTTVRSTSLDSAVRSSSRSISPEWNLVSVLPSSLHQGMSSLATMQAVQEEKPVADHLGITDRLQASPKEWSEFMQGLLESTASASASASSDSPMAEASASALPAGSDSSANLAETITETDTNDTPMQDAQNTPDTQTARHSDDGNGDMKVEVDLGSDTDLDLSLSVGPGINPFIIPDYADYASGRASPSVYSTAPPTPCASPPPSEPSHHSVVRSPSSLSRHTDRVRPHWWRKFLGRVGQLQKLRRMLRSVNH